MKLSARHTKTALKEKPKKPETFTTIYFCTTLALFGIGYQIDPSDGQFSERCDVDRSFFISDAIPIIFGKSLTSPLSRLFSLTIIFQLFCSFWDRLFCNYSLIDWDHQKGSYTRNQMQRDFLTMYYRLEIYFAIRN